MKKLPLIVLGILLIIAGPLMVLMGTAYTLMLPNMYVSSVRIKVSEDAPQVDPFSSQESYSSYNPNFLRTQFEILQSKPMLEEVINRLNLRMEWGRDGEKLPLDVAYKILKNSVSVFQQRDTSLIYISVKRDNPIEAAEIANELVDTYRDLRMDQMAKGNHRKVEAFGTAVEEQKIRMEAAEGKVEQLRSALSSPIDGNEPSDPEHRSLNSTSDQKELRNAIMDLVEERFIYDQLNRKLREKIITLEVPRNPVEIIDRAEPNMRPVSPNLFMNVLLSLALAALPMFAGIVLVVVGAMRKSPPPIS